MSTRADLIRMAHLLITIELITVGAESWDVMILTEEVKDGIIMLLVENTIDDRHEREHDEFRKKTKDRRCSETNTF